MRSIWIPWVVADIAAPVDLPPPPPHSDPREPSPATVVRGRGSQTPHKPHSPQPSRGSSPSRPAAPRAHSSDLSPTKSGSPPMLAPTPLSFRAAQAGGHFPHSRPVSPAGSMHSSTSAIFERDIEHPNVSSLGINPNSSQGQTLNHKSSRLSHLSHGSPLDHSVPAVLDDAVEALAGTSRGFKGLEIESPAPTGSAMGRQPSVQASSRKLSTGPAGATLSRSPSPISIGSGNSAVSPTRSPPILGAISTGNPVGGTISPLDKSPTASFVETGNVPRPAMPGRMSTGPQLPGAWSFGNDEDKSRKEEDKVSMVPSTDPIAEVAPAGPATAAMSAEEVSIYSFVVVCRSVLIQSRHRLRHLQCQGTLSQPLLCPPISTQTKLDESRSSRTMISCHQPQRP